MGGCCQSGGACCRHFAVVQMEVFAGGVAGDLSLVFDDTAVRAVAAVAFFAWLFPAVRVLVAGAVVQLVDAEVAVMAAQVFCERWVEFRRFAAMRLEICGVNRVLGGVHVAELVVRAAEVFHDFQGLAAVLAVRFGLVLTGVGRVVRSRVDTKIDLTRQQLFLEILLLLVVTF